MIKKTVAAGAAVLTLLVTACGDDDPSGGDATATSDAPAVDAPARIVSLSASATEMLFAIGAGDLVVAADSNSNFPAEAPTTEMSAYEPNVEAISDHEPDVVIVDATNEDLVNGLETIGIEVFDAPAADTLEDVYDQLVELGELTGHVEDAQDVVDTMKADIEAILAEVPELDEPLTYFHELDELLFSVTSGTFIGELYSLAGLENVADAADADNQSGGYPQLSPEFLVDADPDLIFLADTKCCAQTVDTFASRPGFEALSAVADGNVILLDDDVASRWGPRVVDLLRIIVDAGNAAVEGEERAAA